MIEKTVYDYLRSSISAPVYMEFPEVPTTDLPEEFVVLQKVGDSIEDYVWSASIAIQSYSLNSLYNAAALSEEVRNAMDVMADEVDEVSESKMSTEANFTDASTKRYRYQSVYIISY